VRFGFFFWPWTPDDTLRMADLGETLGFDLVGIADTPGNAMDPWVAMTLAASRTRRVRLPVCVTNIVTRHPAISASAAASVGLVAGPRTILGIGAGHSGVANVGGVPAGADALREAIVFMRTLFRGEPAMYGGARAHLPWVRHPVPVYLAGSGPAALEVAGTVADGAFVNYGLETNLVSQAAARLAAGARAARRAVSDVDVWHIACLDCDERREKALDKLGNILGFVAVYILGRAPEASGVPAPLAPAIRELRRLYTTERHAMDPGLVKRLGLFDYLRRRLAIAGTPEDCHEQVREAEKAGVRQIMFSVSLAADPERTVELFGRHVLPAFGGAPDTTATTGSPPHAR
jgi:5,10-methylenetetrahydromethanopterin reductase